MTPHIDNFQEANRKRVLDCIKDKSGRLLSKDEFTVYVEQDDEDTDKSKSKPEFSLTGDAKEALKDYYDAVHTLCEAQTNFAASTKVLDEKI